MGKRPTFKQLKPTDSQQLNQIIDQAAQQAPVQIQGPKKKEEERGDTGKGGRPRKYTQKPVKRTVNVPVPLDLKLIERAEKEAAGNVTAVMLRALEAYL